MKITPPVMAVVLSVGLLSGLPSAAVTSTNVVFPDPNLEAAVRAALSKPTGPIASSDMETLTFLRATSLNVTNLSGLEWASNLVTLDVSGNAINDVWPLAGLSNLRYLNAGDNQVQDVTPLSDLTGLTNLWLYGNPLSSLAPIANLSGLTSLALYNSGIADVSPLAGLTNLHYLELRWNPLTNAETVLGGLTNLTTLYLGGTGVSNVGFLQPLTQLAFLNLDHNHVTDLVPLAGLPQLTGLDASYNPLVDPGQVAAFTNLTSLYLSGNSISDATVFAGLAGLVSLMLNHNLITDPSPLAALTDLNDLGLSWNPMPDCAPLAALTNLTSLWLDGPPIGNLDLSPWTQLKALSVRGRQLTDLAALDARTNLVAIYADHNRLTGLAMFQSLPPLLRLDVTGNLLDLSGEIVGMIIEDLQNRGVHVEYIPQNQPPGLTLPSQWTIAANATSSLGFNAADDRTPGGQLLVTADSSNPDLVPAPGLVFTGFNPSHTLVLTPGPDQTGESEITVTVTDEGGLSTNLSLLVTVAEPQPVTIPQLQLLHALRSALEKPTGVLNNFDLQRLTYFALINSSVSNLTGLEWASNLTALYLDDNPVHNLDVLANLTSLTSLTLVDNDIVPVDFSPLSGLTNLIFLELGGNFCTNVAFLGNLAKLQHLNLNNNRIDDLWPLTTLTNLEFFYVQQNRVTDPGPLAGLPRLRVSDLRLNLVDTNVNSQAMSVIGGLQSAGVLVSYLPQRFPLAFQVPAQWMIDANMTTMLSFSIQDNGPISDELTVIASSSAAELLPDSGISVSNGDGASRRLTVIPLPGQTGTTTITLSVTNDLGWTAQTQVPATVAPPMVLGGQSVNNTNLTWWTGVGAPWFAQTEFSHDGVSARSGSIGHGGQSWLETGPVGIGTLTFWWKVSSETNSDWLEFYIDGVLQPGRISGLVQWEQRMFWLPFGAQTLTWRYSKDPDCCKSGLDAAFLDEVTFIPGSWLEPSGRPTNGHVQLLLHQSVERFYEIQASSNLIDWFPLQSIWSTNPVMPFLDTSATSEIRFYRARH